MSMSSRPRGERLDVFGRKSNGDSLPQQLSNNSTKIEANILKLLRERTTIKLSTLKGLYHTRFNDTLYHKDKKLRDFLFQIAGIEVPDGRDPDIKLSRVVSGRRDSKSLRPCTSMNHNRGDRNREREKYIARLQANIEDKRKEIKEKDRLLAIGNEKILSIIKDFEDRDSASANRVASLKNTIVLKEEAITRREGYISSLQADLKIKSELILEKDVEITEWNNLLAKRNGDNARLKVELATLRGELDDVASLREQVAAQSKTISSREDDIIRLRLDLKIKDKEIHMKDEQILAKDKEIASLPVAKILVGANDKEPCISKSRWDTLPQDIAHDPKHEIASLKNKVASRDGKIAQLKQTLALRLKILNETVVFQDLKTKQNEIAAKNEQIAARDKQIVSNMKEYEVKESRLQQKMRLYRAKKNKEIASLRDELTILQVKLMAREDGIGHMRMELKNKNKYIFDKTKEIAVKDMRLASKEEEIALLQEPDIVDLSTDEEPPNKRQRTNDTPRQSLASILLEEKDKKLARVKQEQVETQADLEDVREDLDIANETVTQVALFTDRWQSKFDDLKGLAEASGVDGAAIAAIKNRT